MLQYGVTAKSYGYFQCTPKHSPFLLLWGLPILGRAGVIPEQGSRDGQWLLNLLPEFYTCSSSPCL